MTNRSRRTFGLTVIALVAAAVLGTHSQMFAPAVASPPLGGDPRPVYGLFQRRLTETRTAHVFFAVSEPVQRPGRSELLRDFAMHVRIAGGQADGPTFSGSQLVLASGRQAITNNAETKNPRNDPLPPGLELYTCDLRIEPRAGLTWGEVAAEDDVAVTINYRAKN